jgi:hypothetical protein
MLTDMGSTDINLAALTRTWQNLTFVGDMVQPSNIATFTPWLGGDTSCDTAPSFSNGASHLGGLLSTDLVRPTTMHPPADSSPTYTTLSLTITCRTSTYTSTHLSFLVHHCWLASWSLPRA